jgi:very-short-patch-repair endonuclease
VSNNKPRYGRSVTPEKRAFAQRLRSDITVAEAALWAELRGNRLANLHFRRQHPLHGFIVDFYCHKARLIIEVDGPYHDFNQDKDAWRESILTARGLTMLRFTNDQVLNQMPEVLTAIRRCLQERLSPLLPDAVLADDPVKPRPAVRRRATPALREQARAQRANLSAAEEALWQALGGKRMENMRFRRKHIIEGGIVDFYCHRGRLVIFIDGYYQNKRHEAALRAHGLTIRQFTSAQVLRELPAILAEIRHVVKLNATASGENEGESG